MHNSHTASIMLYPLMLVETGLKGMERIRLIEEVDTARRKGDGLWEALAKYFRTK